jgi:hypothetical protein
MADTATAASALKSYADIPVLDWDLQDPHTSSYELFKDLREKTPLVKVPMGMGSMVMGLHARMVDDIVSPENTRQLETEMKMMQGIFDGPIFDFVAQVMLFANGDVHQRRRQPVARTFAFKLMEAMRPKAAAVAAEIINDHLGKGPFDFLKEFAAQLPARIIADILGIPRADLPVFMKWISDTAESIGFVDVARRADIEQSLAEFNAYVDKLLADRRANPRGDFLSDYVAATAASGDMSEGEIRAQVVGLILAGSDTTRNSMCMSLYQLLQHPDQWAALVADPDGLKKKASRGRPALRAGRLRHSARHHERPRDRRLSHPRRRRAHGLAPLGPARSRSLRRPGNLQHPPHRPATLAPRLRRRRPPLRRRSPRARRARRNPRRYRPPRAQHARRRHAPQTPTRRHPHRRPDSRSNSLKTELPPHDQRPAENSGPFLSSHRAALFPPPPKAGEVDRGKAARRRGEARSAQRTNWSSGPIRATNARA